MFDAEGVVQDLHHGGETVGGARGVGNDVVFIGVVEVVVDAQHYRYVFPGCRGGDDHLLGPSGQVAPGFLGVGENPGGLHHEVNAHFPPWYLGRVALGENLDATAVNHEVAVVGFHGAVIGPVVGVVLVKVGIGLGVGQVVDRRDFQ